MCKLVVCVCSINRFQWCFKLQNILFLNMIIINRNILHQVSIKYRVESHNGTLTSYNITRSRSESIRSFRSYHKRVNYDLITIIKKKIIINYPPFLSSSSSSSLSTLDNTLMIDYPINWMPPSHTVCNPFLSRSKWLICLDVYRVPNRNLESFSLVQYDADMFTMHLWWSIMVYVWFIMII